MRRNRARSTVFAYLTIVLVAFMAPSAVLATDLRGKFHEDVYMSPSAKLECDLSQYTSSPGFFINDAYDPGDSETLSFGLDAGTHFEIWTVRRQREGRVEYPPMVKDGFLIDSDTFIPYFYSELPYDITSVGRFEEKNGAGGVLRVRMDGQSQLHGYWLERKNGWLTSVQFVPSLVEAQEHSLQPNAVKETLRAVLERCNFK